ncbi:hypothetical protein EG359_12180 [Chryseobacterium joostei]|uniref:Lipoprotein n=1 Tax=Chryseobacterium joostei TaxID=112234 RepID=A0A1N7IHN4_9FLAO|nr:hypothetical protein [Chryseobacterium joostei]AZB00330.1 hypothetical protein EG359_12180 [Chryseobacterium joostei]SIS36552.1 hypothetical protein SAMN05421768_105366 [Chryseobacterium joostei]
MKPQSLLILAFSTLLNINCTSQQKAEINKNTSTSDIQKSKIEKIELQEQTRGTRKLITFTSSSKVVSLNGEATIFPLSSNEWKKITEQANQIELSKISTLKAPTSARFSDGALSATVYITSDGQTYTSSSFDSGVPPKELEKLYQVITK